jgi:hypothetical protein
MYKLFFANGTVRTCHSLHEWHSQLIKLNAQGINYRYYQKHSDFCYYFYF